MASQGAAQAGWTPRWGALAGRSSSGVSTSYARGAEEDRTTVDETREDGSRAAGGGPGRRWGSRGPLGRRRSSAVAVAVDDDDAEPRSREARLAKARPARIGAEIASISRAAHERWRVRRSSN